MERICGRIRNISYEIRTASGWLGMALALSACQLDLQVKDLSSGSALEIIENCPQAVYQTKSYACSLSLKGAASTSLSASSIHWFLAPENTCSWANIDSSSGVVTGVPQPTDPVSCQLSFYAMAGSQLTETVSLPVKINDLVSYFGGQILDVAIQGNYAYFAKGTRGLEIYENTNPVKPVFKSSYNTDFLAVDVVVSGNYAYVAHNNNSPGTSELLILDISDPANPALAGSLDTAGVASAVALDSNYAYIADSGNGLLIVDISDPKNPVLAGSYDTAGFASGVAIAGNYAYIADFSNGLVAVDITDPTNFFGG